MNNTSKWTIAGSLFAVGLLGTVAIADDAWPGRGPGFDRNEDRPAPRQRFQGNADFAFGGPVDGFGPGPHFGPEGIGGPGEGRGEARGRRGFSGRGQHDGQGGPRGEHGFGPGHGPGHGPGGGPDRAFGMLNSPRFREKFEITDEQWEAIEADRTSRREQSEATREQVTELQKQLHEILTGEDDPDIGEVQDLAGQIDILRSEQHLQMLGHAVFIRETLTSEQESAIREATEGRREQMQERVAEWKERRGERGERGDRGDRKMRDDRGPRGPVGQRGHDGRRGFQGRAGGDRDFDGSRMAEQIQERLAEASPEEAAEIRSRVQGRVEQALERIEKQQAALDALMQAIAEDADAE